MVLDEKNIEHLLIHCCGEGLWKDLSKESGPLQKLCDFVIGDDSRVNFWCGEGPLQVTFPAFYILAETRGAKAAAMWDSSRG